MTKTTLNAISLSRYEVQWILQYARDLDVDLLEQLNKCKNKKGPHQIMFSDDMIAHVVGELDSIIMSTGDEDLMHDLIYLVDTLEGIECELA